MQSVQSYFGLVIEVEKVCFFVELLLLCDSGAVRSRLASFLKSSFFAQAFFMYTRVRIGVGHRERLKKVKIM